jgi:hypothetical protein
MNEQQPLKVLAVTTDDGTDGGAILYSPDEPLAIFRVDADSIRLSSPLGIDESVLVGSVEMTSTTPDLMTGESTDHQEDLALYVSLNGGRLDVELYPNLLNRAGINLVRDRVREQLTPEDYEAMRQGIADETHDRRCGLRRQNDPLIRRCIPPAIAPEPKVFSWGKAPKPEELVPANYRLTPPARFADVAAIAAEILEDIDVNGGFSIRARLPARPDLDLGPFWFIELNGKHLEEVVIKCEERRPGEYDNLTDLAGCIRGVYEAVLKDHREWLDQLRIGVALVKEYPLPLRSEA